ncbi:hypothetical protein P3L10_010605 [Capsicum annuum]
MRFLIQGSLGGCLQRATRELRRVVHPWIVSTEHELGMTFFITLDLINTIANPTVELIKKELAGATSIRRAFRQGQPNVEALHNQPIVIDLGAVSGGVAGGVVDVGGSHVDASRDDEHLDAQEKINMKYVDEIPCLMRDRQLAYPNAYDAGDRIMDLNFYNNFKYRYEELIQQASTPGGLRFDSLVSEFEWDEDMINYVRGKRSYPYGKDWTKAKRILSIMNVDVKHFLALKILLEEGMMKVYDCKLPVYDEADFFTKMQPLLALYPNLLRQSKLMNHFPVKWLKQT